MCLSYLSIISRNPYGPYARGSSSFHTSCSKSHSWNKFSMSKPAAWMLRMRFSLWTPSIKQDPATTLGQSNIVLNLASVMQLVYAMITSTWSWMACWLSASGLCEPHTDVNKYTCSPCRIASAANVIWSCSVGGGGKVQFVILSLRSS